MNTPILDGFYDSKCFLTAEKCIAYKTKETKKYIKEHGVDTAILVFNGNIEQPDFLPEKIKIGQLEFGEDYHGIYVYDNIVMFVPFVGNPNASGVMEELHYLGINKFIAAGSAGLIDGKFDPNKLFIIDKAIRDEGGSYHYLPAETYVNTDDDVTNAIKKAFDEHGISYEVGTTWTIDSLYKESEQRISKRISQGATAVEMECATWCAVAKSKGLKFGQFLFFSDIVSNNNWEWDNDYLNKSQNIKDKATLLCLEIAKKL